MHVLHVLNELKPSGAEVMLAVSFQEWVKEGVVCEVLSTGDRPGVFAERLRQSGYAVSHIRFTRDLSFFWKLFLFLRRKRFDAVILHAERASFWILLITLLNGARCVRVLHAIFPFDGLLRKIRGAQRRLLSLLGVKFIGISPSVVQNEYARFSLKCELIANWVDSATFRQPSNEEVLLARESFGIGAEDFVFVSMGNCSVIKNHTELINALACVKSQRPWRYLHVGLEQEGHPERELVKSLGIEDRVIFAGWLASPREALWAADCFVMTSLHEGLGNAVLEALSTGLPVILTEVEGLRDLGLQFPELMYCGVRAEDMVGALSEALERPIQRASVAPLGYADTVSRYFGVKRGVLRYANALRSFRGKVKE